MRARPQRLRGDAGTTLAELSVAMVVFGIFAAFLATTVTSSLRLTRESGVRELTAQRTSVVMAQVTKDLRTAVRVGAPTATQLAFVSATDTEVVFHSSVEPAILRERLYVSGDALFRETKLPDAGSSYPDLTYTSTDPSRTTTRRLAGTGIATTGLFAYYVRGSATPVTIVPSADLKDITAIDVRISLDGDGPAGLKPVVLEATVHPYNT